MLNHLEVINKPEAVLVTDPDSYYWRAVNEYYKLVNEHADMLHSLSKGEAYAIAWVNELFPESKTSYSYEEIYWGLRNHNEHPEECTCDGTNNPLGCAECRVGARVNSY